MTWANSLGMALAVFLGTLLTPATPVSFAQGAAFRDITPQHNNVRAASVGRPGPLDKLEWGTATEEVAAAWAKTCAKKRQDRTQLHQALERALPAGTKVATWAQNVSFRVGRTGAEPKVVDDVMKLWTGQIIYFDPKTGKCEPPGDSKLQDTDCMAFLDMTLKTKRIGCAIKECQKFENGFSKFFVVCDYHD